MHEFDFIIFHVLLMHEFDFIILDHLPQVFFAVWIAPPAFVQRAMLPGVPPGRCIDRLESLDEWYSDVKYSGLGLGSQIIKYFGGPTLPVASARGTFDSFEKKPRYAAVRKYWGRRIYKVQRDAIAAWCQKGYLMGEFYDQNNLVVDAVVFTTAEKRDQESPLRVHSDRPPPGRWWPCLAALSPDLLANVENQTAINDQKVPVRCQAQYINKSRPWETALNRLHFFVPKKGNRATIPAAPSATVIGDRRPILNISTSSSSSDRCNMRSTSSSSTDVPGPESTVRFEEVEFNDADEEVDWNDVTTNDAVMEYDTDSS